MFCFVLNWRKNSNYFKIAVWQSDSLKRNFRRFTFKTQQVVFFIPNFTDWETSFAKVDVIGFTHLNFGGFSQNYVPFIQIRSPLLVEFQLPNRQQAPKISLISGKIHFNSNLPKKVPNHSPEHFSPKEKVQILLACNAAKNESQKTVFPRIVSAETILF